MTEGSTDGGDPSAVGSRAATTGNRRRVLVVCGDTLSRQMAGPGIRAWHMALLLAQESDVRLVSTSSCDRPGEGFRTFQATWEELREHVEWAEVAVVQGYLLTAVPWLVESDVVLVCDLYDPLHLEQLEQAKDEPPDEYRRIVAGAVNTLNDQVVRGDFFLAASERQRDLWLGQLGAAGRLNPDNYEQDRSLRRLIDVVPFGLPAEPPRRTGPGVRGVVPGIGADDRIIIWAGGVYNWFDPETVVRAVDLLRRDVPTVRLYFMGMTHPNPDVPRMRTATRTRELSDRLGLTGSHVFFNAGWVDYDERQNYLLDADIGVTTHFDHLETTFSFRTRVLDYLWAGLPVVSTVGDHFGSLVEQRGLGAAVRENDVEGLRAALERLLTDPGAAAAAREAVGVVREEYAWPRALAPLLAFCRDPRPAPDRAAGAVAVRPAGMVAPPRRWTLAGDVRTLQLYIRQGGVREVVRRTAGRLRRLLHGDPPR
ncbi:MAG: glycosyltransferase [Blastococcus sp.]|jgi:glycosyltransferase involved in cell wall biosynthesis|nr:glycosyltransferase [Blastococcus sp.]